jgi:hypothetical protein
MPALIPRLSAFLCLSAFSCFAQGGSAVITLVMPPPGGDGYSALESGGAFAEGATSMYYNPALLPELERSTGSQLFFSESNQDLLPVLNLPDLYNSFTGVSAVIPDHAGYDVGLGFSRSHVSFGENQQTDANGNVVATFDSHEDVYALGVGVRLGFPVSLGAAVKYYDSELARGISSSGESSDGAALGWAFDLGAAANPHFFTPPSMRAPYVDFSPSLSVAWRNWGPDAFYFDAVQADPLPSTLAFSEGLRAQFFDAAEAEAGWDQEREITHRGSSGPVYNNGFSLLAGVYRFSRVWLDDRSGKRFEVQTAHALEINFLRLHRFFRRLRAGDFSSPSQAMEGGYPFRSISVLGVPFRSNPRMILGTREIESRDNGIRDGQSAFFVSFSL